MLASWYQPEVAPNIVKLACIKGASGFVAFVRRFLHFSGVSARFLEPGAIMTSWGVELMDFWGLSLRFWTLVLVAFSATTLLRCCSMPSSK